MVTQPLSELTAHESIQSEKYEAVVVGKFSNDKPCNNVSEASKNNCLFRLSLLPQYAAADTLEAITDITHTESRIALIETRIFLRECIGRGMQAAFSVPLDTYSSGAELENDRRLASTRLVIISTASADGSRGDDALSILRSLSTTLPDTPIVIIANHHDPELARAAISNGAKGYIPTSTGFEVAVEAVRLVLAGGIYVPPEFFLTQHGIIPTASRPSEPGKITAREMLVARGIQQGKPNKIIAHELNMSESTVKVHVRHIMKKWGVKNRTAVAMRASA